MTYKLSLAANTLQWELQKLNISKLQKKLVQELLGTRTVQIVKYFLAWKLAFKLLTGHLT